MQLPDQQQRQDALDIHRSFIIQAPAGSGKTELLIQRYLALLAVVEQPEEVVAITFTKKAAHEMRARVLAALHLQTNSPTTQSLVARVQLQNKQKDWDLLNTPNRLRIMTIDALCHMLVQQMPVLARFGSSLRIATDPTPLYQNAIAALLQNLERDVPWSKALQTLLLHLDNRIDKISELLTDMLAHRDQWLAHILRYDISHDAEAARAALEFTLSRIVSQTMQCIIQACPSTLVSEILALSDYAAHNLKMTDPNNPITACANLASLPDTNPSSIHAWFGLQKLLQTGGQWRKRVDKNTGFPPANGEFKKRMTRLLENLTDYPDFAELLACCHPETLPSPTYSDSQWNILQALMIVLKQACAFLLLEFSQTGQADFIQIAELAHTALGEVDNPSDLALILDYRIQHILVDEFQDTSHSQFRLLEKLTGGWQPDDGRTLFMVGDPMQSIYRFREADVGLFLRAKQHGIGQVVLHSLQLSCNFRSTPNIVDWNNLVFKKVLPLFDDIASGQVSFTASYSMQPQQSASGSIISVAAEEATSVANVIATIKMQREKNPTQTIAILVRARPHLTPYLAAMKQAHIAYQAVEIESLADCSVILDLLALTCALIHPADRIAWLSVLRAPWSGLTLATLLHLVYEDKKRSVFECLLNETIIAQLPADEQTRIQRILPILQNALQNRQRGKLADYIRAVWLQLGGPACLTSDSDFENAETFFTLLDTLPTPYALPDSDALQQRIRKLFASSTIAAENPVQVMTIHKAKGLEFDCVILPALEKSGASDDKKLLMWLEMTKEYGDDSDLLLAPIKSTQNEEDDPLYQFIDQQNKQKIQHELRRLFYVAATRAKSHLYLFATIEKNPEPGKERKQNTFYNLLWRAHELHDHLTIDDNNIVNDNDAPMIETHFPIYRLPATWQSNMSFSETIAARPAKLTAAETNPNDNWQARQIGKVVHHLLQQLGRDDAGLYAEKDLAMLRGQWRTLLIYHGLSPYQLESAVDIIQKIATTVQQSARMRWLFSKQHRDVHNEFAMMTTHENVAQQLIVDRTFIDEKEQRWIVDYKTASPEPGQILAHFFAQQKEHYLPQMHRYAAAMQGLGDHKIKLGLYFPVIDGWCEWDFSELPLDSKQFFNYT